MHVDQIILIQMSKGIVTLIPELYVLSRNALLSYYMPVVV